MYSSSVLIGVQVLIYTCRLASADVCSYVTTKDCSFVTDQTAVCATNGITYRNSCFLAKAYCQDNSIHKAHDGPCSIPTSTTTTTTTTTASTVAHSTAATSDPLSVICSTMDHVHCANDIEPVCGSDDRTYVNSCEFHKEVCQRHGLTVKHIGFC